jgi:IrrE N-terminal-like domain
MNDFRTAETTGSALRNELIVGAMSTAKVLQAFRLFLSRQRWTLTVVQFEDCDPNIEAWSDPQSKTVFVRSDVLELARLGNGRACFTLVEEMAHIRCGHSQIRHRKTEYSASERAHDGISSDERMAKMVAAAFLMPKEEIANGTSAQDVSNKFGVSLTSADIRLKDLARHGNFVRERREIPESVADFVAEARRRAAASRQAF